MPDSARRLHRIWYCAKPPPWYLRLPGAIHGLYHCWRRPEPPGSSTGNPVPLIIVGNLVAGGSGKTPLVMHLAGLLQAAGFRTGVIARVYRGRERGPVLLDEATPAGRVGDEPVLLFQSLKLPVVASRKRSEAYDFIIDKCRELDVVISDDGLQHRSFRGDVEIAVVDAARGFGNGRLLPAGPLREPPGRLARCDYVVIKQDGERAPDRLAGVLPEAAVNMSVSIAEAVHVASGERRPLADFRGRQLLALAAVANPESFFRLLRQHGLQPETFALMDHAAIPERLIQAPSADRPLLMTAKDAVKWPCGRPGNAWYVPLRTGLPEEFEQAFVRHCRALRARP